MTLRRDLVAYWTLNETGGYREDSHGAGSLADNNTVLSATGKVGNAADFETSNKEYLSATVADFGAAPSDGYLTVSCWVRLESKTTRYGIISTDNGSGARSWRLDYDASTDRFRFLIFDAAGSSFNTVSANNQGAVSTATWYHLLAWHDPVTNQIGIQVNNGTADTQSTTIALGGGYTQLYLGAYQPGPTMTTGFDGLIDEVALWRRLLTNDEKTSLYNSGAGSSYASWWTDSGVAFVHYADAATVAAYDATLYTYQADITIPAAGRYAIGVRMRQSDDGDSIRLKIDGDTKETRAIDDDRLANLFGIRFEDGFIYEFGSSGTYTLRLESVSNAAQIGGVCVRRPDTVSGIVEDQGAATHCEPLSCVYGGSTYAVHVELYTGHIYLTKDGTLQGRLFDGDEYNERYHNGAACVAMANGVAVFQAAHTAANGMRARYLPGGSYASISSEFQAFSPTDITYIKAHVLSDDRVAALVRAESAMALALFSDLDEIDGAGASATLDVLFTPLAGGIGCYPTAFDHYSNGSVDLLCALINSRDGSNNWGPIYAVLFCPQEGSVGEWYSLDGVEASNNTALGTAATPRFTSTQRGTATGSGGIYIQGDKASGQQYALSGLFRVTQWPSGATPAKAACLFAWAETGGGLNDYDDATAIRFALQYEGTKTADTGFADLPSSSELSLTTNNYRLDAAFTWVDDDPTEDALLAITDRRWSRTGTGEATNSENVNVYYDWGGHEIAVLRIANPHNAATIAFSEEAREVPPARYASAFLTRAGTNKFCYQSGDNQLHATHRQSTRRYIDLDVGGTLPVSLGSLPIGAAFFGDRPITDIYLGGTKIWP